MIFIKMKSGSLLNDISTKLSNFNNFNKVIKNVSDFFSLSTVPKSQGETVIKLGLL